jgi:signal transduction histidine kinase
VQLLAKKEFRYLEIEDLTDRRAVIRADTKEGLKPHTVLVCEDNQAMLQFLYLNLCEAFQVITAIDGLKGWELVQTQRPTLVVTDLMMPGIDGLELCQRIKSHSRLKSIPVIMLTAKNEVADRILGKDTGADGYLSKPFAPGELLAVIKQLIRSREDLAVNALEERMESLDIMSAGLAHEIKNPLSQIKSSLFMMQKVQKEILTMFHKRTGTLADTEKARLAQLSEQGQRMAAIADKGVDRIGQTVNTIAEYAKNGRTQQQKPYKLDQMLEEILELVGPREEKDVAVNKELKSQGRILCVYNELSQAFINLLQNAIDTVPHQGCVWIKSWAEGPRLMVTVRDNGPGIQADAAQKIFTPFYTTKDPGKGMGLGLTIAHRTVKKLNGEILLKTERGQGTEFTVILPACEEEPSVALSHA